MRRVIFGLLGVIILASTYTPSAFGQAYPERAINLIVPMAPGDGLDVAARLIAEELAKWLKVPVVVVNKPGAAGGAGTAYVTRAKDDGYTLLLAASTSIIYNKVQNPTDVPYDSFRDLTPLGLTTLTPMIVTVRNDAAYQSLKKLVTYANLNPGKIRFGTAGAGSTGAFDAEIIKTVAGMNGTVVPFEGASPAIAALLGGHVEVAPLTLGTVINHLRGGKIKGIAISNKFPEFTDIPTFKQLGYRQELIGVWFAFYGPAGLPAKIKEMLSSVIEKATKDPALSAKAAHMGMIQEFEPPEKLLARMHEEYKTVQEIATRTKPAK